MKTNEIADVVIKSMVKRGFPIFLTTYQGHGIDEADVFGINKNGYIYEYEIKRSRSDFQAEFRNKKWKHNKLKNRNAIKLYDEWKNGKRTGEQYENIKIPNRYFFVCQVGLIQPSEIPEYAGLIYIINNNEFSEVKSAKLLHRNKANIRVYQRVATILSQRMVFGCSYYSYLKNKLILQNQGIMKEIKKI